MLTCDDALALVAAARAAVTEQGVPPMAVAVVDAGGHLLALARMDGAPWIATTVAQGKAWTAAAYGAPSAAQRAKMESLPNFSSALSAMTGGSFTPQTGAVPVFRDGELLGAVGASGGSGEQDEAVCAAAVAATAGLSVTR